MAVVVLPIDSRISSLLYSLQAKERAVFGNNQVMIDTLAQAISKGLIK